MRYIRWHIWCKRTVSRTCLLCPQLDSAPHILSGCQHTQILRNMITERHNVVQHDLQSYQQDRLPRILLCLHGYRSSERLAMQNLQI